MIKPTYYTRDYERWITPVYCQRGVNLLFHAFGTTKYESISCAQLIQTALDLAQEMSDLNQAQHEARNELPQKKKL